MHVKPLLRTCEWMACIAFFRIYQNKYSVQLWSCYSPPPKKKKNKKKKKTIKISLIKGTKVPVSEFARVIAHNATEENVANRRKFIRSSTFPDELKKVQVIPLHKQLEKVLVDNHRPICLLKCFSKTFKRLIHKQVINFLQKHALLYQYQFGLREKHSTTLAIIEIIGFFKNDINNGDITIGIYLDFKKAFDTVNHIIRKTRSLWHSRDDSLILWTLYKQP